MPSSKTPSGWVIVVPVKGTASAKSRFGPGDNSALALAMALDTVAVALEVGRVIVVTSDAAPFAALPPSRFALTVEPDPGGGLNAAITAGLVHIGLGPARAVLLGDHPGLTAGELREALAAASEYPLAFVADADGEGTALTAAAPGVVHVPRFGADSAAEHLAAGYVSLGGVWPGLRRDVDTAEQLAGLDGVGAHTRAFLVESRGAGRAGHPGA